MILIRLCNKRYSYDMVYMYYDCLFSAVIFVIYCSFVWHALLYLVSYPLEIISETVYILIIKPAQNSS